MNEPVPYFEGHPVAGTAIKMSGAIPMDDLEGAVIGIDDVVQLICQFLCINVTHVVNKDGELIRTHVLRPVIMVPKSLDPDDDAGDFVLRALPRPVQGTVSHSSDDDEGDA